MATSQNGYSVLSGYEACRVYYADNVKFYLRPDSCGWVLADFASKFDDEVENLNPTDCHGFSRRAIAGTNEWSNHASGTAVDLNATQHPHGSTGTFTSLEVTNLRDLLEDYDGVLRWGGDYRSLKDEMHVEIDAPYNEVLLVAQRLRRKNTVRLSRLRPRKRNIDVYMVKRELDKRGYDTGPVTKYFSMAFRGAYQRWQMTLGYTGADADGIPGSTSLQKLGFKVTE